MNLRDLEKNFKEKDWILESFNKEFYYGVAEWIVTEIVKDDIMHKDKILYEGDDFQKALEVFSR
jgi:hypothetical protein